MSVTQNDIHGDFSNERRTLREKKIFKCNKLTMCANPKQLTQNNDDIANPEELHVDIDASGTGVDETNHKNLNEGLNIDSIEEKLYYICNAHSKAP